MRYIVLILTFALMTSSVLAVDEEDGRIISPSNAENFTKIGADGGQFLKIGVGARGTAMAGAFSAIVDDLTALHYNPAGINGIDGIAATFNYTQWFGGFSHNFAAVTVPIGDQFRMAASVVNFTTGDIEVTTILDDQGTGAFYSVQDLSAQLTFAGRLTTQFTFGITAKYVQLAFSDVSSGGLALDIGTQYDTGIEGIKFGFSVHNLGTDHQYDGEGLNTRTQINNALEGLPLDARYMAYPFSLPLMFRIGIGKDIIDSDMSKLTGTFDFITSSDVPEQFAVGAEYLWNDLVYLRGGYLIGHDQISFAGGAGLKYLTGNFQGSVDYSINPTADLGIINRFTIGLDF